MRAALFSILALSVATPALAAPGDASRDARKAADALNNRFVQSAMAGTIDRMMAAILDIRIDGVAKAMAPLDHGRSFGDGARTVRDMAERDDPYFEERMHDNSRAAIGGVGALASALATAMPELEAAARKMRDAIPDTRR